MERQDVIRALIGAWNAQDGDERQRIVSKTLADDFYFVDTHQHEPLKGKRAYLDYLTFYKRRMNGVHFDLEGEPNCHHAHAQFSIAMREKGECVGRGIYVADFTKGDRVQRLVGFEA